MHPDFHIIIRDLDGNALGSRSIVHRADTTLYPVPDSHAYTYESQEHAGEQIIAMGLADSAYIDQIPYDS